MLLFRPAAVCVRLVRALALGFPARSPCGRSELVRVRLEAIPAASWLLTVRPIRVLADRVRILRGCVHSALAGLDYVRGRPVSSRDHRVRADERPSVGRIHHVLSAYAVCVPVRDPRLPPCAPDDHGPIHSSRLRGRRVSFPLARSDPTSLAAEHVEVLPSPAFGMQVDLLLVISWRVLLAFPQERYHRQVPTVVRRVRDRTPERPLRSLQELLRARTRVCQVHPPRDA